MAGKPKRRGELVQSPGQGGWTIYVAEDDLLHIVNESARAIWELCDGDTTIEEMGLAIAETTAMTIEESSATVRSTLDDLTKRGLVRETNRPGDL